MFVISPISASRARLPCGCCSDLVPRDINNQPTNQPAMIILRKGGAAGDVFPSSSREGGSDPDIPFSSNQITPSSLYPLHPTVLTQGVPGVVKEILQRSLNYHRSKYVG